MKKFTVPLPPALDLPENTKEGKEFEVLAKLVLNEDGKLEIISFDGADVFDPEELEKEEEKLKKEIEEAAEEFEKENSSKPASAITDEDGFMSAVMKDARMGEVF